MRNIVVWGALPVQIFAIVVRGGSFTLGTMKFLQPFTRHPASVGESYPEHLLAAGAFSLKMIAGGLACLLHAILPFLFVHTGSNCIAQLHRRMSARQPADAAPGRFGLNQAP